MTAHIVLDCMCGRQPALVHRQGWYRYQCPACGASGAKEGQRLEALRAWNTERERKDGTK